MAPNSVVAAPRPLPKGPAQRAKALLVTMLTLVATALGLLTAPAAQAATPTPEFGTQFHGLWANYTDATRAQVLDTLKAHGATTVRLDVSWRMLEPTKSGQFHAWGLAQVDKVVGMANARGLRPMVTLWMSPTWATGSADERVAPTSAAGLQGLTSVSQRLAAHFAGKVDGWEVWNEPNSNDFMRGESPVTYANVLRAAYKGFKAGNPNTKVVFGGTMYTDTPWITKALAAGAAGNYDVMGVHPYMGVGDASPELPSDGTRYRMNYLPTLVAAMAARGDGNKPIWFTEFGWRARSNTATTLIWQRGVTPEVQAAFLYKAVKLVQRSYPMVTRMYWYGDRADSANPKEAGYGLVLPGGIPMPALRTAGILFSGAAPDPTPRTLPTKPLAPAPLKIAVVGTTARVTWTRRVGEASAATAYYVQVRRTGTTYVRTVKVPATTLTVAFANLARGAGHRITVVGVNAAGLGTPALSWQFIPR